MPKISGMLLLKYGNMGDGLFGEGVESAHATPD